MTLWCRLCWVGYASLGEIPAVCPACMLETRWTTDDAPESATVPAPIVPWVLSAHDAKFLRALRILRES